MKALEVLHAVIVIIILAVASAAMFYGFVTAPQETQNMMMWMMMF